MTFNVEKMYTYLRGYLSGAKMEQSIRALSYAREKHEGQFRKDGIPYIVHPLQMACYGVALGIRDDNVIAGALLHDVCEDCNIPLSYLPVNNEVKQIVKYMTITPLPGEEKKDTKRRYFESMLDCKGAIIVKGLDRYHNMSSMAGVLDTKAIWKNIHENDDLLLPMMKQAKERYPELADILFILRFNIRSLSDSLKALLPPEEESLEIPIPFAMLSPEEQAKAIEKPETMERILITEKAQEGINEDSHGLIFVKPEHQSDHSA